MTRIKVKLINFWIATKGSLGNKDGDSNKDSKKSNNFILVKQQLCTRITLFASSLHNCEMKLPNFTCPLYRVGEHNTKNSVFLF